MEFESLHMHLEIIYEDEYCAVVNKPSDLIIHHSKFARNIEEVSLVDLMRVQLNCKELSPVHRLDRKTSGLVLFVKSKDFAARFQEVMTGEQSEKIYWSLLRGHVKDSGSIETPVKNERGNYQEAFTGFKTLLRVNRPFDIPPYPEQRYSVVQFVLKTGRYHQLRQHANKIAHPVINDPKHGNRHHNHFFTEKLGVSQLFLHARFLRFVHPYFQKEIAISAPLPDFWFEVLERDIYGLMKK